MNMELKKMLKYRNVWLGLAMIFILWYHSKIVLPIDWLKTMKRFAYGGVDICLFASGAGCYFSLQSDSNPYQFLKRRFKRLIPTYWTFLVFWIIYRSFIVDFPLQAVIGNAFFVQDFTGLGNDFNWYISGLLLLYVLSPYLKGVVENTNSVWKQMFVLVVLFAFSIPFWNSNTFIITVSRIPIFYLGMVFAKKCEEDKAFTLKNGLLAIVFVMLGSGLLLFFYNNYRSNLWAYGLYWYPFILIAPGLCMLLSVLMEFINKWRVGKWIKSILSLIGKNSFEIYLVHIPIFDLFKSWIKEEKIKNSNELWLIALLCVIIGCFILKILTKGITKLIYKVRH